MSAEPMLYAILSMLGTVITFLFLIGALIWTFQKRRSAPRSATLAIAALMLLLMSSVLGLIVRFVASQFSVTEVPMVFAVWNLLYSLCFLAAIALLLRAAFTANEVSDPPKSTPSTNPLVERSDKNPYAAP